MHSDIEDLDEVTYTFLFQRKNNNKKTLNISSNFSVLSEVIFSLMRERERETLFSSHTELFTGN